jgi:hypothetical protein
MDLIALLIQIVVGIIILAPVLWIAGRLLAGKDKAKFTDAILIVILGMVIDAVVSYIGEFFSFFAYSGLVAAVILFIVWLALIKHFFDCGWLKAFVIAVLAVIIFVVIVIILALIGIGIMIFAF